MYTNRNMDVLRSAREDDHFSFSCVRFVGLVSREGCVDRSLDGRFWSGLGCGLVSELFGSCKF